MASSTHAAAISWSSSSGSDRASATPAPDPAVSIIIPTYNSGTTLLRALGSVAAQTSRDWEVIVVDDGSTDNTVELLDNAPVPINYIHQENRGIASARNRGIGQARGEFIAFLDADDEYLPGKIENQLEVFRRLPYLEMVNSGWILTAEDGSTIKKITPWTVAPELDLMTYLYWKPVFPGAMMLRASMLRKFDGFNETYKQAEDVELVLRMLSEGVRTAWLYQPTVRYHQHATNITADAREQIESLLRVLDDFFARDHVPRQAKQCERTIRYYTLIWCAWHAFRHGNRDLVSDCLSRSLECSDAPPAYVVLDWFDHFDHWKSESGEQNTAGDCTPLLHKASGIDPDDWTAMEDQLRWRRDVWRHYLTGFSDRGAARLSDYHGFPLEAVIDIARKGLLADPSHRTVDAIDRFWRDSQALGIADADQRGAVASLYLTLFAQCLYFRRWKLGVTALGRALKAGKDPRGVTAWGCFLGNAMRYYAARAVRSPNAR